MSAAAALLFAPTASAGVIVNGSFESGTPSASDHAPSFSIGLDGTLTSWSAATTSTRSLDCLVAAGATTNMCGTTAYSGGLTFWSPVGASPDGGNYVAVDGDASFSVPLTQSVTGLVVGQQYWLSFYQAAAQQSGYNGATTEQWKVSLGGTSQYSTLMSTPNHGSVGWMSQSMVFTALSTNDVVTFLAVGTPSGTPPFVFLDGVSMSPVPEPSSMALIGLGFVCLPFVGRWRGRKQQG